MEIIFSTEFPDGVVAKKSKPISYKEKFENERVANGQLQYQNRLLRCQIMYQVQDLGLQINRMVLEIKHLKEVLSSEISNFNDE